MKYLQKSLLVFGYVWLTLAGLLILGCLIMVQIKSGVGAVMEILNPFNIINLVATLITLAPGYIALHYAEKVK